MSPRDTPARSPRSTRFALPLAIVLAAVLAFEPSRRAGYVQDDLLALVHNRIVERGDLREILTTDYWAGGGAPDRGLYRPVTILSYALEVRALGAARPAVSHGVNLILHALVSLALYGLARRLGLGRMPAGGAALLFAVHPLHTGAVANVAGRAELLAALFSLAALLAMGHARDLTLRARLAPWVAGALLFLGLGSKEVAFATPPLLLLQVFLFGRGRISGRAGLLAPAALATVAILVLRALALGDLPGQQSIQPMDNALLGLSGAPRVATALGLAARYARLFVWPVGLSPDYSGSAIAVESSIVATRPLLGLLVLGGLCAVALLPWIRPSRRPEAALAALGAWMFLAPYAIVGNLFVLNGAGFAERLMYFPSAGLCLLVSCVGAALPVRAPVAVRAAAAATAGVTLLACLLGSRAASRMWTDEETLFAAAAQAQPRAVRPPFVLGRIRMSEGRTDEALRYFERAIAAWPAHTASWIDRGMLLAQAQRWDEAEAALREAARQLPDYGETRMYLGMVLARRGRIAEAERELRRALLLSPGLVKAAAQLAHLYFDTGRYAEAARMYRRCVEMGRTDLAPRLTEAQRLAAS